MGRTTLKDVGDHVGVSAKTVSNVVNGTGWVREDLKVRIREALVELGYRPNAAARQLRSGRSDMVAVALPDLAQPYFAELASELVRAAEDRSITVLINQTNGQADAERRISDGVGIPVMDGLILSPLALTAQDLTTRLDATPIVLLGEHIGVSPFPHVTVDNTAAAQAATEHLIAGGHRRIAAIGAQPSGPNETSELRLNGYRAALESAGIRRRRTPHLHGRGVPPRRRSARSGAAGRLGRRLRRRLRVQRPARARRHAHVLRSRHPSSRRCRDHRIRRHRGGAILDAVTHDGLPRQGRDRARRPRSAR